MNEAANPILTPLEWYLAIILAGASVGLIGLNMWLTAVERAT